MCLLWFYLLNLVALCGMWETLTKSPGLPATQGCVHVSTHFWDHTQAHPDGGGGCQRGMGAVCLPTIPNYLGVGWASPFSQQEDTIISILQVGRLKQEVLRLAQCLRPFA